MPLRKRGRGRPSTGDAGLVVFRPSLGSRSLTSTVNYIRPLPPVPTRIRLSIAQKQEQMPGLSTAQRLRATENKRQILQEMDRDRAVEQAIQHDEDDRIARLRQLGV